MSALDTELASLLKKEQEKHISPQRLRSLGEVLFETVNAPGIADYGQRYLLNLFDQQSKNNFEVILMESGLGFGGFDWTTTSVIKLFLQSISMPFPSFEYEAYNEEKMLKGITHPETCTLTFIEDETGRVKSFLNRWINKMVTQIDWGGMKGGHCSSREYVFNKNQNESKKDALIILNPGSILSPGAVVRGPFVKLKGLKPQTLGELTVGHAETDMMTIEATCAIDNSWFYYSPISI